MHDDPYDYSELVPSLDEQPHLRDQMFEVARDLHRTKREVQRLRLEAPKSPALRATEARARELARNVLPRLMNSSLHAKFCTPDGLEVSLVPSFRTTEKSLRRAEVKGWLRDAGFHALAAGLDRGDTEPVRQLFTERVKQGMEIPYGPGGTITQVARVRSVSGDLSER